MIKFTNPTIDLVRTYDMYETNSKDEKKWHHSFGYPAVNLAIGVIGGWPYEEHLLGIRDCLEHTIINLRTTDYFFKIPVGHSNVGDNIRANNKQRFIADSLIFSVIEFHDNLHEHGTGMSEIARTKLRRGFELSCLWGGNIDFLNPDKNDWIVTRDNKDFMKYIINMNNK